MILDDLVVEITRRCNASCDHCLRGDAQNIDISNDTMDNLLEDVKEIRSITFSGGEPSLAVDRIEYFTKILKEKNITLGDFYVITNGKTPSIDLVKALIDLYAYAEDNEISALVISGDQYHQEVIESTDEARGLYEALSFFNKEERKGPIRGVALIDEGRAAGMGGRDALIEPIILDESNPDEPHFEGNIYINALGDIEPSCDLSFESQEKEKLGNVNEEKLQTILKRWAGEE